MKLLSYAAAHLALAGLSASAVAAEVPSTDANASAEERFPANAPDLACDCLIVPALTPVSIQILAALGSKVSKSGDTFPIRLAAPVIVDETVAIPAGAEGMGEVVHAKKGGGMGAAGELVLAARYLNFQGKQVKLRSMKLATVGKSNIDSVNTMLIASSATFVPIALLGFVITGGQAVVPLGATADAKTAEAIVLELQPPAQHAAGSASVSKPLQQGEHVNEIQ